MAIPLSCEGSDETSFTQLGLVANKVFYGKVSKVFYVSFFLASSLLNVLLRADDR